MVVLRGSWTDVGGSVSLRAKKELISILSGKNGSDVGGRFHWPLRSDFFEEDHFCKQTRNSYRLVALIQIRASWEIALPECRIGRKSSISNFFR